LKFQVETGEHDPPSWWLIDDDGHPMAWAGVHFSSLAAADQAAHQFRAEAESAVIEVDPVAELGWRWSAWLGTDNRVAVSCGTFPEKESAVQAARLVLDSATRAIGP